MRSAPSKLPRVPLLLQLLFRLRIFRASDSAMGDLLEEYSTGRYSKRWVWQQAFSTLRPGADQDRDTFLGSPNQVRERKPFMFQNLRCDVRYTLRTLRLYPAFSITAIVAIALGVGINTGLFTVWNGLLLRSLPVPQSEELVQLEIASQTGNEAQKIVRNSRTRFSVPEYEIYRDTTTTLSGLAAFAFGKQATLGSPQPDRAPQIIAGELVSCNYFVVLQVPAVLGPGFTAADCQEGAGPAVVLSHQLWTAQFDRDPDVIGRYATLNQRSFRIAGIAPEGYQGTDVLKSSFWAPLSTQPILDPIGVNIRYDDDNFNWVLLLGRRRPNTSLDQVRADIAVIATQIDRQFPGRTMAVTARAATVMSTAERRTSFMNLGAVLFIGFGLVLLMACANVANLLLARSAARRKEIAVRLAVGASRGRLLQQWMTESAVIALLGGVAGSLLAAALAQFLVNLAFRSLKIEEAGLIQLNAAPDGTVLAFALGVTLLTGLLFGLAPALNASRPDVNSTWKQDGGGDGGQAKSAGAAGWIRGGLVAVQIAVCMILMISAGLLLRGAWASGTVDPGFTIENITMVAFDLEGAGYDAPAAAAFDTQVRERIGALPGVEAVAQTGLPPLSGSNRAMALRLSPDGPVMLFDLNNISPGYLEMLEIPILRGRDFLPEEIAADPATALLVTQATAERYWPGADPIGKTVYAPTGPSANRALTVIGVVADTQVQTIGAVPDTYGYFPLSPQRLMGSQILVRSQMGFAALAPLLREQVNALDAGLVVKIAPLEDNLEMWRSVSAVATTISGVLALVALALAMIGVYGVVAFTVSRRLKEVGIRMALGGTRSQVISMLVRQAMKPVAVGVVAGIAGSAALTQLLRGVLFGVSEHDPLAFVTIPLLFIAVAVLATAIPARRALSKDPMKSLRYQ